MQSGPASPKPAPSASGSGSKMKHVKKPDGIPLWRADIQYDFLHAVFHDQTRCFHKPRRHRSPEDETEKFTFAQIYLDAMASSSKCSKLLKEKLLSPTIPTSGSEQATSPPSSCEAKLAMAMVCLLINIGRMNTTLNFFPQMRAQLRTYHSIPSLQVHGADSPVRGGPTSVPSTPNSSNYKQLQDAPRLKAILKGCVEDEPTPTSLEDLLSITTKPRTNAVNLVFILAQFAPRVTELHFPAGIEFFDLIMRRDLESRSRARAFLWLIWFYLEGGDEQSLTKKPFGSGQHVPELRVLSEEEAARENVDTAEEIAYGERKREERIAVLATEPSPAMTALNRARREKAAMLNEMHLPLSEDDGMGVSTRSPSPAVGAKGGKVGDVVFEAVTTSPLRQTKTVKRRPPARKEEELGGLPSSPSAAGGSIPKRKTPAVAKRSSEVNSILSARLESIYRVAKRQRDSSTAIKRAFRRLKKLPSDYDSEEERIKRSAADNGDAPNTHVLLGGLGRVEGEENDYGEEAHYISDTFRRSRLVLEREYNEWDDRLPQHMYHQ
ncbi:hypothetical protein K470DRAFT_241196 [Piedraia hortae CBS 480.64]|uniref:Ino eighty subunit 1 n=1 Tax=Piedraia hortae CBS 480.64 TaxID=1314780 RepID=A0A6A7C834_9PEZI|nr:hypothetical protein K470DRAFT_241196 [Piedraia hortae CBS 480.64]